jgi:hypothetical protein
MKCGQDLPNCDERVYAVKPLHEIKGVLDPGIRGLEPLQTPHE